MPRKISLLDSSGRAGDGHVDLPEEYGHKAQVHEEPTHGEGQQYALRKIGEKKQDNGLFPEEGQNKPILSTIARILNTSNLSFMSSPPTHPTTTTTTIVSTVTAGSIKITLPRLQLATLRAGLVNASTVVASTDTKDVDDVTGIIKYGWDVIARPTTWMQECMTVMMPGDAPDSAVAFTFPKHSADGHVVLRGCIGGSRRERLVWTKNWAVRTTQPFCFDAGGLVAGDALAVRPCRVSGSPAQVWIPEKVGRWRKLTILRNPATGLCLATPAYNAKDRRIRMVPCSHEPVAICPLLWVATSSLPMDGSAEGAHPEAITPGADAVELPDVHMERTTAAGEQKRGRKGW